MITAIIIIMCISQLLRCIYNTLYVVNVLSKIKTPMISSIYYLICSFIYSLIVVTTAGAKEINELAYVIVFLIEPVIVFITGIMAFVKSMKKKQKDILFSLLSGVGYLLFFPLMPIIDVIIVTKYVSEVM